MEPQAQRLSRGDWYLDDDVLRKRRLNCWRQLDSFNLALADDDHARTQVMADLLGEFEDGATIIPRFQCSYGYNIRLGANAFVNANGFFMDDAPITIGAHARIGPGAQLMTAVHPVDDHRQRREGWERAAPIVIGENTWLGASVTVGAGVSIGRNTVIGAGSVVLRDIPDHVVAAGTPAAIIRRTAEEAEDRTCDPGSE